MRGLNKVILTLSCLVNLLTGVTAFSAEPYCMALRGNGELEPAHWGALAQLVEKMGPPQAQAGGSSAAISMFMLESILSNKTLFTGSSQDQSSRLAFLLKSMHGISLYLAQNPKIQQAISLQQKMKVMAGELKKGRLSALSDFGYLQDGAEFYHRYGEVLSLLKDFQSVGIASSERYQSMLSILSDLNAGRSVPAFEVKKAQFYAQDLYNSVSKFGSFDAASDDFLFFREGIINFREFGEGLGRIATFLAGVDWDSKTTLAFEKVLSTCEPIHSGLTWLEILEKEPRCQQFLNTALGSFFEQDHDWKKINVVYRSIGGQVATYPTTSVLIGSAYLEANEAMLNYHQNLDRVAASKFKITDSNQVRLGYWGSDDKLKLIETHLKEYFPKDLKSSKFISLGSGLWIDALSVSPAEPGLANLQRMNVKGEAAFSAGGWSDLHPVLVLKAAGCKNVVYVTRQGGESLFAQGIAKRLFNLERSWELLRTNVPQVLVNNKKANNQGDPTDRTSNWSRLYNVANSESSFMMSVQQADAVLCTDWNRYDVKSQMNELVQESYQAPFIVWKDSAVQGNLESVGAKVIDVKESQDKLSWIGCRPPYSL